MKHILVRSCLLCLIAALFARPSDAENWPHWRGPRFDGTSTAGNLPTHWSRTENVLWRLALPGEAASTPVVWGDRIFLTSTDHSNTELSALAVDRQGKVIWQRVLDDGTIDVMGGQGHETAAASPSPVTDGKHLWVLFGTGTLHCVDVDGNPVWQFDIAQRYGQVDNYFGLSMSPLLYQGRLYLQLLHADAQLVAAVDAATGEHLWSQQRATEARVESLHSYASPIPFRPGPDLSEQLLIHGADYITAHSLSDGHEIWRFGSFNPAASYNPAFRLVATPVTSGDLVIVPTAKRGPVFGLRPGGTRGQISEASNGLFWTLDRGTPDVPSPLVHEGLVYLSGENGRLTVVELGDGSVVYAERVHQSTHRGSPVAADGKILLVATDGTISVVRPGRRFEILAKNRLEERLAASPAISDDTIYLRTWEALYAIGLGGDF